MRSPFGSSFPLVVLVLSGLLCAPSVCAGGEQVSVTVYNQDLAVVRELRDVEIASGVSELFFPGVATELDPTSVRVRFPGKEAEIQVLSQRYRYDVAGTARLLKLALGKEITVRTERGEVYRGMLLGYDGESLVLKGDGGSTVAVRRGVIGDLRFPQPDQELVVKPTLSWEIQSDGGGMRPMEVTYLTSGMKWQANYVAVLSRDAATMELSAWAAITNNSGKEFRRASLTLVAGTINRGVRARRPVRGLFVQEAKSAEAPFESEELFEYHAYVLDRPLDLDDKESVQMPLVAPHTAAVERVYTYDFTVNERGVVVTAKTVNAEDKGLGIPLPAGTVRIYGTRSEGGNVQLLGEDRIGHTPVGADLELTVGLAFDLKAKRKRTDYTRVGPRVTQESYEIELRSGKDEPAQVIVREHPRGDWRITESSTPYERVDASTAQWTVTVPPRGSARVTYTVEIRS